MTNFEAITAANLSVRISNGMDGNCISSKDIGLFHHLMCIAKCDTEFWRFAGICSSSSFASHPTRRNMCKSHSQWFIFYWRSFVRISFNFSQITSFNARPESAHRQTASVSVSASASSCRHRWCAHKWLVSVFSSLLVSLCGHRRRRRRCCCWHRHKVPCTHR